MKQKKVTWLTGVFECASMMATVIISMMVIMMMTIMMMRIMQEKKVKRWE